MFSIKSFSFKTRLISTGVQVLIYLILGEDKAALAVHFFLRCIINPKIMMQDIKLLHSGCEFLTADQLGQNLFDEHEG